MRSRTREGFSLIEALVALTIAALVLGAIFELQIQMVRGQQRAVDAMEQVMAQENALALTRTLNPMARPEGSIALPAGFKPRAATMTGSLLASVSGFFGSTRIVVPRASLLWNPRPILA